MKKFIISATVTLIALISLVSKADSLTVDCLSDRNPDKELVLLINNATLVQIQVRSNGYLQPLPFTTISTVENETRYNVTGLGLVFLANSVLNDKGGRLSTSDDSFYCM